MKVRRESVQTRSETGTRRREALRHTREYVEGLNGETARHSSVFTLAAEAL
jgi:hypothetical protein